MSTQYEDMEKIKNMCWAAHILEKRIKWAKTQPDVDYEAHEEVFNAIVDNASDKLIAWHDDFFNAGPGFTRPDEREFFKVVNLNAIRNAQAA